MFRRRRLGPSMTSSLVALALWIQDTESCFLSVCVNGEALLSLQTKHCIWSQRSGRINRWFNGHCKRESWLGKELNVSQCRLLKSSAVGKRFPLRRGRSGAFKTHNLAQICGVVILFSLTESSLTIASSLSIPSFSTTCACLFSNSDTPTSSLVALI